MSATTFKQPDQHVLRRSCEQLLCNVKLVAALGIVRLPKEVQPELGQEIWLLFFVLVFFFG